MDKSNQPKKQNQSGNKNENQSSQKNTSDKRGDSPKKKGGNTSPKRFAGKSTEIRKESADLQSGYLWAMSQAPKIDASTHSFQLAIAAFFTAFIILVVRASVYTRPMEQFYWSGRSSDLTDFFSYAKMVLILVCAGLALLVILYRLCVQTLAIKRSYLYIPAGIYSVLVILSYLFSEYKDFSLLGYNDRFEGTLVLLAYMVMMIFIFNIINTEKNVKWILYPLAFSSVILSLIGISQALDHDFFQTTLGKMLILPSRAWSAMDTLSFTFQNREIYQTVYNINYVSFYLTLLIPLFGMLFIHSFMKESEEPIRKKLLWGIIFALLVFNLIGSASSGGLLGMAVAVLAAFILLNKKILQWIKPVAILLVIAALVFGATANRWIPEFTSAVKGVTDGDTAAAPVESPSQDTTVEPGSAKPMIDYIITAKDSVTFSINGNPLKFQAETDPATGEVDGFMLYDEEENPISLHQIEDPTRGNFSIQDERFENFVTVSLANDEGTYYILVYTEDTRWPFMIGEEGIVYHNQLGKTVELIDVPHTGWENNLGFGSGRGFIWSRTLPMMKDTLLLGYGADTYCLYFPHRDYAGKYSSGIYALNTIVDKPHNMYMGIWVGTGGLSCIALLALWGIYLVQSYRLYFRSKFEMGENSFLQFVGAGICLGITGFLAAGLVNDSSVSVMPMFYGLLATGIAINMILKRRQQGA